ncbi:transposase [Saccharothrix carnea]|nr:transposase [Saccharothrix carnea]
MKHYPPEFRAEAVALYRSRPGATIKSVAEDLGVNHETPRNWIRLDDAQRTGPQVTTSATGAAPPSPEDENAGTLTTGLVVLVGVRGLPKCRRWRIGVIAGRLVTSCWARCGRRCRSPRYRSSPRRWNGVVRCLRLARWWGG